MLFPLLQLSFSQESHSFAKKLIIFDAKHDYSRDEIAVPLRGFGVGPKVNRNDLSPEDSAFLEPIAARNDQPHDSLHQTRQSSPPD